ncbi:septum site-determining protein MinC [Pleurocapsales cyanobacterium LEGE 06147]|nr:septum site-determining protein MinC [Pleurocapsales cyanobacterium LEGE 06147]
MTSESTFSIDITDDSLSPPLVARYSQVLLKSEGEKLLLILPTEQEMKLNLIPWSEVWQELKHHLQGKEQSWQAGSSVSLIARDQLLDARQLHKIAETLSEVELGLEWVYTSRRQTAVAAAAAGYSVEQQSSHPQSLVGVAEETKSLVLEEPLYLQNTIRSGVEVRHRGTIIVLGDVNPGGAAIAAGDIFVWGRLRGIAHAGAQGNRQCRIMALQMEPKQLRIADMVARAPKFLPDHVEPEVAYVTSEGIRLAKAMDFAKTHSYSKEVEGWKDSF